MDQIFFSFSLVYSEISAKMGGDLTEIKIFEFYHCEKKIGYNIKNCLIHTQMSKYLH